MSESAALLRIEQPARAGARMSYEAARIAARLAGLLGDGSPDAAFMRTMEELSEGAPPKGRHRLDRLAAALGLSPVELDLLALAGLAEEHDGYAAVLRRLHPRREPLATAGLAARLFCVTPEERQLLRETLLAGPAVSAGALRLVADGPFFERSLLPAEGLWPSLGGLDAWPEALEREEGPVPIAGLDEWFAAPLCERAAAALAEGAPCTLLVTADDERVAQVRALALARNAGVDAVGLTLPPEWNRDVEDAVAVVALAPGVKLLRPTAGRDSLVVTPEVATQLDEAVARLVYQSRVLDDWGFLAGRPGARGVRMLFTGPPGTGKTLSAEVMARTLDIDLLVVDVSRVVSKWIGETEKNLAQVFEVAARAQAVLFFD